jgi:hypothetical protein
MYQWSNTEKQVSEELAKRLGHNDFKATDGCFCGNEGFGYNSIRHTVRRPVLMLQVLNDGNPHSCQTCFRNFAQMISTMPMKQVHFIVPCQTVP